MNAKEVIVWTAIVTPFSKNGKAVDYDSFKKILRLQEEAGNGILILGSTGEGLAISEDERKEMLKFTSELKLKVPLMVGVSGFNFEQSLNWVTFCSNYNVDAFLLTTPSYTKPGAKGQSEWFARLMDVAKKPCVLYNIPGRTGVPLFPETIKLLQDHPSLWAIKESSGSVEFYCNYKKTTPRIEILCGDDYFLPFTGPFKVKGLISVASNVWPKRIASEVHNFMQHGKIKMDIVEWWDCMQSLYVASNPVPTKSLLHNLGIILHPTVRIPLSVNDLPSLDKPLIANKIMNPTS